MPSLRLFDAQKRFSTALAWLSTRLCSQYFISEMYQVPIDMIARRTMTLRATKSPLPQSEPKPYGLASSVGAAGGGAATAGAGAGAAAAGAGAAVWSPAAGAPPGDAMAGAGGVSFDCAEA